MLATTARITADSRAMHHRRQSECSSAQRPFSTQLTPLPMCPGALPAACRHIQLGRQRTASHPSQYPSHMRRRLASIARTEPARSSGAGCRSRDPGGRQGHMTCAASVGPDLPDTGPGEGDDQVAAEFQRLVNERGMGSEPTPRCPTHLMPPTTVVAAQLDALQRNDWPEADAGVHAAFSFSMPLDAEKLLPGQVARECRRVHAWAGTELWLPFKDFSNMLHSPPYSVILNCDSWQLSSPLLFPSQRSGERALQAVQVVSARRGGFDEGLRPYTFTFCLERVEAGPFKNCWMTVGLRVGDYASV